MLLGTNGAGLVAELKLRALQFSRGAAMHQHKSLCAKAWVCERRDQDVSVADGVMHRAGKRLPW